MADEVLAELTKNGRETIRVRRTEYQGHDLLDVRVFTVPVSPDCEALPTKKGLCLRPETWRALCSEVAKALDGEANPEGPVGTEGPPWPDR